MEIKSCNNCKNATLKYDRVQCDFDSLTAQELFKYKKNEAALECKDYKRIELGDYTEISHDRALKYLLAGQAEFVITSGETGKQFFYKLMRKDSAGSNTDNSYIYWLMSGDIPGELMYSGSLFFNNISKQFEFSRGSMGNGYNDSVEVKSIIYLLNRLHRNLPVNIKIYHNGTCANCNGALVSVRNVVTGICNNCDRKVRNPSLS